MSGPSDSPDRHPGALVLGRSEDTIHVVTMAWTKARGLPPTLVTRVRVGAVCYDEACPRPLTRNLEELRETWNRVAVP